jgi:hypothetical protein
VARKYSHSSDDRNFIWDADVSASTEYSILLSDLVAEYTKLLMKKIPNSTLKQMLFE